MGALLSLSQKSVDHGSAPAMSLSPERRPFSLPRPPPSLGNVVAVPCLDFVPPLSPRPAAQAPSTPTAPVDSSKVAHALLAHFGSQPVVLKSGQITNGGSTVALEVRLRSRIIRVSVDVARETALATKSAAKLDRELTRQEVDSISTLYASLRHMGV